MDEARDKHAALRKLVRTDRVDPLARKRAAKSTGATPSVKPPFGVVADDYVATHEGSWHAGR